MDQFVYSYVPKEALDSVLVDGLFGGEAILKRPDLLEIAADTRGMSAKQLEKDIKKNLSSWSKWSSQGPNVVFHMIPDVSKLSKKHPVAKYNLVPIKINLSELLHDHSDTKIFGIELEPFVDGKSKESDRYHFLNRKEVNRFLAMSPKELWSTYNDIEDKGLYAPDVPHASIHTSNGIIPAKYIKRMNKTAETKNIPHSEALEIIGKIKERLKKNKVVQDVFSKHNADIEEIDYIPVCFSDLDVSARTDHGIIYLNKSLLEDGFENDDHYLVHEFTHFLQQTTGDKPTQGSTDDTYLDNEFEQSGFRTQTEYLSDTRGDDAAEKYIDKVLKHHDVPKNEHKKRKQELLQLASEVWLEKKAGLLKVPAKMLEDITKWADGVFAAELMVNFTSLQRQDRKALVEEYNEYEEIERQLSIVEFSISDRRDVYEKQPHKVEYYNLKTPREIQFKLRTNFTNENLQNVDESTFEIDATIGTDKIHKTNLSLDEYIDLIDKIKNDYFDKVNEHLRNIRSAHEILDYYLYPSNQIEYNLFINNCKKYASYVPHYVAGNSRPKKEFKYSDYFDDPLLSHHSVWVVLFLDETDAAAVYKSPEGGSWAGLWRKNYAANKVNSIWVIADLAGITSTSALEQKLSNLNITIRHELQHLVQDALYDQKNLNEVSGLPSKKIRDKNVHWSGMPLSSGDDKRIDHRLRDVEFYTNLTDSVESFNNQWGKFPAKVKELAAKKWVGLDVYDDVLDKEIPLYRELIRRLNPSSLFLTLKEKTPEKWKKAVKEFYKAAVYNDIKATASHQSKLKFDQAFNKTKEELMADYEKAIERGPQEKHVRPAINKSHISPIRKEYMLAQLKKIMQALDSSEQTSELRKRLDRKKQILQLALKLDE